MLVCLLPAAFFTRAVLPSAQFLDVDGFYHYKIAQLIGAGSPWVDIRWLPYTVLGPNGPDLHWLFHVLIAPFTWVGNDILGLKLAIIVLASLIVPVLYLLLRKWQVPHAWLFALLALFGSLTAPWRFEMLRAQGIAVALTCCFVYVLVRQRHAAMFFLVWLFFNTYYGAAVTAPIAFIYLSWGWLAGKPFLRTGLVYMAAVVLAFVVNPWFPRNIEYFIFHTLYNTLYNTIEKTPDRFWDMVGGEWLPYPPKDFLVDNALLLGLEFVLLLSSVQDMLRKKPRVQDIPAETVIMVGMSLLLLCATLYSLRFVEYYAPFSALASGLLLRDIIARRELNPIPAAPFLLQEKGRTIAQGVIALLMLICMERNQLATRSQQIYYIQGYKPLADYLEAHVPKGTLLFNSAWSDFPQLLWYTTDYSMANGLDGKYLANGDPQRFDLWYQVTQRHHFAFPDMPGVIARSFNTRWLLIHKADDDLARYLLDSHQATLRLSYDYGWLFEVDGS